MTENAAANFRADLLAQREYRADTTDQWVRSWAQIVLTCIVLYLFIGTTPWHHEAQTVDDLTGGAQISPINRYAWIMLTMMSAPLIWARRARLREVAGRLWPLIIVYVWFWMTTHWALDPGVSNKRLFLYTLIAIIGLALGLAFDSAQRLHRALAVACAIMVFIDMATWIVMPGASMTDIGLAAIHNHKNTLGQVMLTCGVVLGPYLLTQRRFAPRMFWLGTFAACVLLLVASQSKTSLAILLVVLALIPILLRILRARTGIYLALFALTIVAALGFLAFWVALCTFQGTDPLAPVKSLTFTQRTDVWAFVFSQIIKHPLIGSGFGSFWDVNPAVQPSLQTDLWFAQPDAYANQAHNGYLDLLVTTGFIGLTLALTLLLRWISRGMIMLRRIARSSDPLVRAQMPYAITLGLFPLIVFSHNFMESSYFSPNNIFGTLVVLIGVDIDLRYTQRQSFYRLDRSQRHY